MELRTYLTKAILARKMKRDCARRRFWPTAIYRGGSRVYRPEIPTSGTNGDWQAMASLETAHQKENGPLSQVQ
ncbi:MAG: hypothetical protein JWO91_971, partial [Acidobacteriaceae bacterium]|nr:hypothetical protein [Acidobacteriaceae bacterium]